MLRFALPLLVATALAACQASEPGAAVSRAEPAPEAARTDVVPAGVCWATDRVPALIETRFVEVAGQTGLQAQDVTLREAEERRFAVPCPEQIDGALIASLQRALTARGHYAGPISGAMDAETAEAVRRFQAPLGLDSGVLSLDAAQRMGLIAIPRDRL